MGSCETEWRLLSPSVYMRQADRKRVEDYEKIYL